MAQAKKKVTRAKPKANTRTSAKRVPATRRRAVNKRVPVSRTRGKSITAVLRDSPAVGHLSRGVRELTGITLMAVSIILLIALWTFTSRDAGWSHTGLHNTVQNAGGVAGAWFADVVFYLLGYMGYMVPLIIAFFGAIIIYEAKPDKRHLSPFAMVRLIGFVIMLPTACGLSDLHLFVRPDSLPLGVDGGGVVGSYVASHFSDLLNPLGATLIQLGLFLGSFSLITSVSWLQMTEKVGGVVLTAIEYLTSRIENAMDKHAHQRKLKAIEKQARKREDTLNYMAKQREKQALEKSKSTAAATAIKKPVTATTPITVDKIVKPGKAVANTLKSAVPEVAATAFAAASVPVLTAVAEKILPKKKIKIGEVAKQENIKAKTKESKLFKTDGGTALPPISMLDEPREQTTGFSPEELESLSRLLEDRLAEFKVIVEVVAVQPGPVITRFELSLAPGTKASKISGLAKDIARSLSIVSVRVVEVIAGKSTIGLEIPNDSREIVSLSEIISAKKFINHKSPLALALGKGIDGSPVIADLAKMPHLLVAGTTGSGKSVGVNSMLISLLYKSTAKEVRLILIDPKMLELNVYEDIPHLLAPVVTDMKEAANALRWAVGEMERRYKLMASLGVRNIAGYNKKVEEAIKKGEPIPDPTYKKEEAFDPEAPPPTLESLPYIVIVVDEFADMIMVVGKKVEELIARIAQKARAAGLHLILATQRPSTDVITGLIKSNIPTRMAFQVSTKLDSRIVLDQGGAESLLGHGDMLYLPPGTAQAERVHGAFVDDHEVHNVVGYLKQQGGANYVTAILEEPTTHIPGLTDDNLVDSGGEKDALYDQAVAIVTETRKGSISYVQRRLKIGYNRAARIVEEMEEAGVLSAVQHNGQREVIAPPPVSV